MYIVNKSKGISVFLKRIIFSNFWAIIILLSVILIFFHKLYYPSLSLFATPDFGQSDIWSLNMPAKFFLSESLKRGELPLWNKDIGGGYPMLAEGQIGTFFIVNLILFKFLPFLWAWNIGYIITFLTTAIGTYLYGRKIRFSQTVATFCALIFSFSGVFITHISHYNLLQAASLLPWLFLFVEFGRDGKWWGWLGLAVLFSQQLFAGFPQMSLISLSSLFLYILLSPSCKLGKVKEVIYFLGILPLVAFLSAAQILPQVELLRNSVRESGVPYDVAVYFSYPWQQLKTMIFAYTFGNPAKGTYPFFSNNSGNVFWENTGFIGITAFLLAFVALFQLKQTSRVRVYFLLVVIALLLMTGKYSPLYLIYAFPPFSFFRAPSRFIYLFVWGLVILAGYGISGFQRLIAHFNKTLTSVFIAIIVIVGVVELMSFSFDYNPTITVEQWNKVPDTVPMLTKNRGRIFDIGTESSWNKEFLSQGWQNMEPYLYFRSGLQANSNVFYHVPQILVYPALLTKRSDIQKKIIYDNIALGEHEATFSAFGVKFLRQNGVRNIVSLVDISGPGISLETTIATAPANLRPYRIYQVQNTQPRLFFTREATHAATVVEAIAKLDQSRSSEELPLILEDEPEFSTSKQGKFKKVEIVAETHQKITAKVSTDVSGYLVVSDSYYPGWQAFVDGKSAKILPANINQRAIFIPGGNHSVSLSYEPESVIKGIIFSISGYGFLILLALFTQL